MQVWGEISCCRVLSPYRRLNAILSFVTSGSAFFKEPYVVEDKSED